MLKEPDVINAQADSLKTSRLSVSSFKNKGDSTEQEKDSLKAESIVEQKDKGLPQKAPFNPGFEIDPVAPIIFVLFYIIDKIYAHIGTNNNNRANWYLEIIIKPNLENIDKLYTDILNLFDSSFVNLRSAFGSNANGYIALVAQALNANNQRVADFDSSFISLLSSHDSSLEVNARLHHEKLSDIISSNLSSFNILNLDKKEIIDKIIRNKIEFYQLIYNPVVNKIKIWKVIKGVITYFALGYCLWVIIDYFFKF